MPLGTFLLFRAKRVCRPSTRCQNHRTRQADAGEKRPKDSTRLWHRISASFEKVFEKRVHLRIRLDRRRVAVPHGHRDATGVAQELV